MSETGFVVSSEPARSSLFWLQIEVAFVVTRNGSHNEPSGNVIFIQRLPRLCIDPLVVSKIESCADADKRLIPIKGLEMRGPANMKAEEPKANETEDTESL